MAEMHAVSSPSYSSSKFLLLSTKSLYMSCLIYSYVQDMVTATINHLVINIVILIQSVSIAWASVLPVFDMYQRLLR